jgi:hypothetical protein
VSRAKLRFEVLFKRFHPRINLTTLFLTETYLLNTIKPFSDHENRFLGPKQQNRVKPFLGGYPYEPEFQWGREPKFQLSRSYGLGCRRVKIFCSRRRRRVTDGKKFIAFFTFYDFLSVKNMFLAKTIFQNFWSETNTFPYIFHICGN